MPTRLYEPHCRDNKAYTTLSQALTPAIQEQTAPLENDRVVISFRGRLS